MQTCRLTSEKAAHFTLYKRLGGPQAGLDGCGNSFLYRLARSKSLYILRYLGPRSVDYMFKFIFKDVLITGIRTLAINGNFFFHDVKL